MSSDSVSTRRRVLIPAAFTDLYEPISRAHHGDHQIYRKVIVVEVQNLSAHLRTPSKEMRKLLTKLASYIDLTKMDEIDE